MKLAILADIHGNYEALAQVLKDLETVRPDRTVALGDNVGYGAQPLEVLEALAANGITSLAGNHETALAGGPERDRLCAADQQSLDLTRSLLSPAWRARIAQLPLSLTLEGAHLVHACPPEDVSRYLFQLSTAEFLDLFEHLPRDVCFVGHSHRPGIVSFNADDLHFRSRRLTAGLWTLSRDYRHIVSVGSVGQPRDGDPRAKYAVWDSRAGTLETRCVAYEVSRAAEAIRRRGFPAIYAALLQGRLPAIRRA